jgi:hypothetical protein
VQGCFVHGVKPEDVTHVRTHFSIRAIKDGAFYGCKQLVTVISNNGFEVIGIESFYSCKLLQQLKITNDVKAIKDRAFSYCYTFTTVTHGDGLEEIKEWTFKACTSLQGIVIPNTVKTMKDGAFCDCSGLTTVTLGNRLEEIENETFHKHHGPVDNHTASKQDIHKIIKRIKACCKGAEMLLLVLSTGMFGEGGGGVLSSLGNRTVTSSNRSHVFSASFGIQII